MSKLKRYKLKDLYTMGSGISTKPEQAGHGSPFVSFRTIFNNYYLPDQLPDLMATSSKEQTTYSVKKGDIFITRTSETLNELAMSSVALKDYPTATFSGFAKRLRPTQNDITYDKFMAFYMRSELFRKSVDNNAIMTLRASFNEEIFSYIDVLLPNYEDQKKVGDFLYRLYSKIQINNQIYKELESLSKTIYDYWFVQFDFPDGQGKPYKSSGGKMVWNEELKRDIPEGWEIKELGDIILKSGTGLNPRDNFKLGFGENYYITIKNVKDGRIIFDESCDRIDDEALKIIDKRSDLQRGDILFTSIEPVGVTYFLHEKPKNWNINESVFTLRPDYSQITSEYLYMLLSSREMKVYTKNASAGSIHKGIRHSVLKMFKLPYRNKELTEQFSVLMTPIFERIKIIDQENQKLTELCDFLLPMLMNGQIK